MAELTVTIYGDDLVSKPKAPVVDVGDLLNFYNHTDDAIVITFSATLPTIEIESGEISSVTVPDTHCLSYTTTLSTSGPEDIGAPSSGGRVHIGS